MNLLYLTHRVPCPPNRGDRIRTYHILRFLAQRANVHLACLADEVPDAASLAELRSLCTRVCVVPVDRTLRWGRALRSVLTGGTVTVGAFRSPVLARVLREWGRRTKFDAAWASSSGLAWALDVDSLQDVPAHVDLIDVDSEKWRTLADAGRGPRAWVHRLEARRLRQVESDLADRVESLYVVSRAEAELYRAFRETERLRVLTNGVDLDAFRPATDVPVEPETCAFVGALDYGPNVDGAVWFARDVWPAIRAKHPQARWRIVGRNPTRAVRDLGAIPGVEVVGSVPDVRPYLWRSRVAVTPLRIARGVQNKVLEAMACGTPVVTSPTPLQGLSAEPGRHLLAARTPDEWVAHVSRLFVDDDCRRELSRAGREHVEREHSWERCLSPLVEWLRLPDRAPLAAAPEEVRT